MKELSSLSKVISMNWHDSFVYEPETGDLIWKAKPGSDPVTRRWNTRFAGRIAGRPCKTNGYVLVGFNYRLYGAHRIIWEMHYGPLLKEEQLDHANKNRADNRLHNLRKCTSSQNAMNKGVRSDNSSGYKGVSYRAERMHKYRVRIMVKGKNILVGNYATVEEAHEAYKQAALEYHGEFARIN